MLQPNPTGEPNAMTRLAILADIHGNLPALEAVIDDFALQDVDHVVVAGDVINCGPFSAQVTERIIREGWAVIRGNNEFSLLDYATPRSRPEWRDRTQFSWRPWLQQQVTGRLHAAIAAWPDTLSLRFLDAPPVRVVHGSLRSASESMFPITPDADIAAMLAHVEETTIIAAHTHIALDRVVDQWHIVNPGSVGIPLDGDFTASYMILDGSPSGWRATLRRVPFDCGPVFTEFERQRFVEQCGVVGQLIMQEFKTAQLQLLPLLYWRNATCPDHPLDAQLLSAFQRVDAREYLPLAYQ